MLDENLYQIGFTKKEAKAYLELSRIGSQAVSVIAKRIGLNRTTTYSILKSLVQKGVISSNRKEGLTYFSANDPNCLVGYMDRKCRTFDYYKTELSSLIPKFRDLRGEYSFSPPLVSYFEGIEGVKHVMYDALNAKAEFWSFLAIHKFLDYGMREFLIQYKDSRIINKKVKLRAIAPDTKEVRDFFNENYKTFPEMTDILFISDAQMGKKFNNQINIYEDKIAILHLEKGEEYGVIIASKEIAAMQRAIFELAWTGCKLGI
jgi:sugar-specific transcriptional regulator TrmB